MASTPRTPRTTAAIPTPRAVDTLRRSSQGGTSVTSTLCERTPSRGTAEARSAAPAGGHARALDGRPPSQQEAGDAEGDRDGTERDGRRPLGAARGQGGEAGADDDDERTCHEYAGTGDARPRPGDADRREDGGERPPRPGRRGRHVAVAALDGDGPAIDGQPHLPVLYRRVRSAGAHAVDPVVVPGRLAVAPDHPPCRRGLGIDIGRELHGGLTILVEPAGRRTVVDLDGAVGADAQIGLVGVAEHHDLPAGLHPEAQEAVAADHLGGEPVGRRADGGDLGSDVAGLGGIGRGRAGQEDEERRGEHGDPPGPPRSPRHSSS